MGNPPILPHIFSIETLELSQNTYILGWVRAGF